MKKLILILLVFASIGMQAQTANGTEMQQNAFRSRNPQTVTSANFLTTMGVDGTMGKITPENLPVSTATQTAIDAKVGDFINDGATTIAPSMNAVYDALQLKQDRTSTTLISGCSFVNNGTTFSINPGVFQIIDNSTTPYTKTDVNFLGVTNVTPLYFRTVLYINSSGTVVQVNGATGDLTPLQRRDNLFLGGFAYSGGTILAPQFTPSIDYDASGRLFDLAETIGARNRDGNIIAANGANLQLNKGAGHTYRAGSNYATNKKSPDVTEDIAIIPIPASPNLIGYRNGSGGWTYESYTGSLTPTFWDNGSGTKATVSNNKFTIPRVYFFNGTDTFVIYLGQTEYSSLDAAKGAIYTETRSVDPATSLATHRCSIPIEKGVTSLSTQPTLVYFENHIDNKSLSGIGGSGGAQNMQSGYNNSVSPQITTTTALGAVDIQRGSASDTDAVLRVKNGAGTVTQSVKGNGEIYTAATPTATAFTHYFGETASDGIIRPKTLANVKTEIVTTAAVDAAKSNIITGTGTTGFLPKLTGTSTLGNSVVSESGFGSILIRGNFDPFGAANRGNIALNGSNGNIVSFSDGAANGTGYIFQDNTDLSIVNIPAGGKMTFATGGVVRGTFTSNGNFLVGTSTNNGNIGRFVGTVDVNKLQLNTAPATAFGTPPLLTWNSSTKDVESVPYATFLTLTDDASTASSGNAGKLRYRVSGNNSYIDIVMQTGASTYEWVNIVQNNW